MEAAGVFSFHYPLFLRAFMHDSSSFFLLSIIMVRGAAVRLRPARASRSAQLVNSPWRCVCATTLGSHYMQSAINGIADDISGILRTCTDDI